MPGDIIDITQRLAPFLDESGRLTAYPAKRKRQLTALAYLSAKIPADQSFTEKEINALLNAHHTFHDWALLRRDLLDSGFITRDSDGSNYRLSADPPVVDY